MTKIKVNQELDMDISAIEDIFKRPVIVAPSKPRPKRYTILKNLSPNRRAVINQCKAALVKQFGMRDAGRYIHFRESNDPRGYQFWLKYQIERTPYMDDYCLLAAAQKWLDRHLPEVPQG